MYLSLSESGSYSNDLVRDCFWKFIFLSLFLVLAIALVPFFRFDFLDMELEFFLMNYSPYLITHTDILQ